MLVVDYTASSDTATVSPAWSTTPSPDSENLTTYEAYVAQTFLNGTAQAGSTSTTLKLAAATDLPDNGPVGLWVWLDGGDAAAGQARKITAYSADTATVSPAWTMTPTAATTYRILEEYPTVKFTNQYQTLADSYIGTDARPTGAPPSIGMLIRSGNGIHIKNVRFLAGTAPGANSKGIVVNGNGTAAGGTATLQNCTLKVHVQYFSGGVGVDLLDGTLDRIGSGNTIWVTHSDGTAAQALELKTDGATPWVTDDPNYTDDAAHETNDVRINGVRYYRTGPT